MKKNPPDSLVNGWLKTLGVERLCQWDVLVFLCRHLASLVSAEHIARLLGYPTAEIVTALDDLESVGLVARSRVDQGVRLYQFAAPADPERGDALGRLLTMADNRAGRLHLTKSLRRGETAETWRAGGRQPPGKSSHRGADAPRSPGLDRGRATWRKAI